MIFCFYDGGTLGVVRDGRVTEIPEDVVPRASTPQQRLEALIEGYDAAKPALEELSATAASSGRLLADVVLEAPVPAPTQLLCAVKNYADDRQGVEADFFLKSALCIVPTNSVVELPPAKARVFHHEAELAAVIGVGGTDIPASEAMSHVFGYTGFLDMSARDLGSTYYMKKSPRTFGPLGPVLVTADEIGDPHDLIVTLTSNDTVRQRFSTSQMANRIDRLIEVASAFSGLVPGDVIATGTYHIGMGPIQNGDHVKLEIEGIGVLEVDVVDPLERSWDISELKLAPDAAPHREAVK